jgi:hypothetical protein
MQTEDGIPAKRDRECFLSKPLIKKESILLIYSNRLVQTIRWGLYMAL